MPKRLALLAALAAVACAPRTPPPDLSLEPAALLAQVRAAQARVRSVRGDARIRIRSPDGSGTVSALVAAERPDRVYVQTVDFFGNTLAVLATAGGALSLYDARAGVLYRGPATAQNLARLVPIPLSPEDLAAILCGAAPLIGAATRADPGRGFVTLELAEGGRTESLRVGPGAAVERAALRVGAAEGPSGWDLEIVRAETPEGGKLPAEVSLSTKSPDVRLRLTWQEAEWNAKIDAALFSPSPPRGARIVDLAEGAPPPGLFAPPGGGE